MTTPVAAGAVSFDCFGTLVAVDRPSDPAAAIEDALDDHGISVPADWPDPFFEPSEQLEPGREQSLSSHVRASLASTVSDATVRAALLAAFDGPVETRPGAMAAIDAAASHGPVGICSNCSVHGLVERTLARSDLDIDRFDAVVTSVDCGWRKPDRRAFEAVGDALGVPTEDLLHVGDDPETDGAAPNAVLLSDRSLLSLAGDWRGG